jgi:hypothetical protein
VTETSESGDEITLSDEARALANALEAQEQVEQDDEGNDGH